jgi:hypothetical protein
VTFTAGPLGLLEAPDAARFTEETVSAGDAGEYAGQHPTIPGWHLIRVERDGRSLWAPVREDQFERGDS